MEAYRKITIRFKNEQDLNALSNKFLAGSDYKLIPAMKDVYINKNGVDFAYKKNVRLGQRKLKEWEKHWTELTEFGLSDSDAYAQINFFFNTDYDNKKLEELLEQQFTIKTKSIWFPKAEISSDVRKRIIGARGNPQFPIYIISKGRSKTCVTADHLIKMDVPFRIVIEKSEWNDYAEVYGEDRLLELDMSFRESFDTYIKDFDDSKSKGSGPARNFVWWHAKNVVKAKWHWIMDDNIMGFTYYHYEQRVKAVDGSLFAAAEDFVSRYDNIGISGLNYHMFAVPGSKDRPYVANTKIYSCLLINNDNPVRWAGRYNEDVDICIRTLKEGYSTIQFDAFLAKKMATQTMAGGNTDAFYAEEGTLPKSNMLMHNHPDITSVMWRFQRWHHQTNYDIFDYYKDRTIGQTIVDMMKPQILDSVADTDIIEEIRNIDFNWIKNWNILENVETNKRNQIIDVLKFNRYTKDNERIIQILTAPKLLNCDYYEHIWENSIPDTEDNRIMKDLLALGDEDGVLFNTVDWDSYLSYVQEDKRNKIVHEMIRNKYLLKSIEKHDYTLTEIMVTDEEHSLHYDSKATILNRYINKNNDLEEPVTLFDKKQRSEIKVQSGKKFKPKLASRSQVIVKDHDEHVVMIHGSEDFTDEELFNAEMNNIHAGEIINSVYYPVDLLSANYALNNKLKNKDFPPDFDLYTENAYKKLYEKMTDYADECILFVKSNLTPDLEYLVKLFNDKNKKIKVVKMTTQTSTLDDWD